jgi:hypothetical protein
MGLVSRHMAEGFRRRRLVRLIGGYPSTKACCMSAVECDKVPKNSPVPSTLGASFIFPSRSIFSDGELLCTMWGFDG